MSPSEIKDNDILLHSPYDANHPIGNLTDKIEDAVEYVAAGQTLYTPVQVITIAYP